MGTHSMISDTINKFEGEIYDIDERMLAQLDILEDYPRLYDRQIQDIVTNDGLVFRVFFLSLFRRQNFI